jgi:hypothetical protein
MHGKHVQAGEPRSRKQAADRGPRTRRGGTSARGNGRRSPAWASWQPGLPPGEAGSMTDQVINLVTKWRREAEFQAAADRAAVLHECADDLEEALIADGWVHLYQGETEESPGEGTRACRPPAWARLSGGFTVYSSPALTSARRPERHGHQRGPVRDVICTIHRRWVQLAVPEVPGRSGTEGAAPCACHRGISARSGSTSAAPTATSMHSWPISRQPGAW